MVTAKMTSKGQLTIPKAVRDSLRLHPGDRVAFVVHDHGEATIKPVTKSVDEVFGRLRSPGQPCRSVAEMKAAVAEKIRQRSS
jgi:AbrB family looped-hinge helix DNA binding protein